MNTKICPKCLIELPVESFNFKKKGLPARNWLCKTCIYEYQKEHYRKYPERQFARNKKFSQKTAKFVHDAKINKPCMDCGRTFIPFAMDFDHVSGKKEFTIAKAVVGTLSVKRVISEMAKCELVCATCHRIRTYNRMKGLDGKTRTS